MNIAVIFAGGAGQRMHTKACPKQFLKLHGKPILVYTLEQFQDHPEVDGIVLAVLKDWIGYCLKLTEQYRLSKVAAVVPGGANGQESIFRVLTKAKELYPGDSIVLIHDGVRPLIDKDTISRAITCTRQHGSAIVVAPATETVALKDTGDEVKDIIDRSRCQLAKAPQCFILEEIYNAHIRARAEKRTDFIDSASLMRHYGHRLFTVQGTSENIKITTPLDFYIFRSIMDAREESQIMGI